MVIYIPPSYAGGRYYIYIYLSYNDLLLKYYGVYLVIVETPDNEWPKTAHVARLRGRYLKLSVKA